MRKKFIVISGELKILNHRIQGISTASFSYRQEAKHFSNFLIKKKSNFQLNILMHGIYIFGFVIHLIFFFGRKYQQNSVCDMLDYISSFIPMV